MAVAKAAETATSTTCCHVPCASRSGVVVCGYSQESTEAIRYYYTLSSIATPLRSEAPVC